MEKKPKSIQYREDLENMYPEYHPDDLDICVYLTSKKHNIPKNKIIEYLLNIHYIHYDDMEKQLVKLRNVLLRTHNKRRLRYLAILLNYLGESGKSVGYPFGELTEPDEYIELKKGDRQKLINLFQQDEITAEALFEMKALLTVPRQVFQNYMNRLIKKIMAKISIFPADEQDGLYNSFQLLVEKIRDPKKHLFFDEWIDIRSMK